MRKWLFAFQKSVALVLTHLMNSAEQQNDTGRNKHTSGKMGAPSPEKFGVGKRSPLNTSHGNIEHLGCVDRNHSPNAGDFRHSDGVENTVSRPFGSSAIPIQVPQQKSSHHGHGHHRSQQQAHSHHAHSHHVHSHHAHSHHSSSRSKSGLGCPSGDGTVAMPAGTSYGYGGTGRGESVDKLATSFKEEDATHLRLEELLHTPSTEESRSRAHSGDSDSNNSSDEEDADGDWRSKSSNEMQNDDEE